MFVLDHREPRRFHGKRESWNEPKSNLQRSEARVQRRHSTPSFAREYTSTDVCVHRESLTGWIFDLFEGCRYVNHAARRLQPPVRLFSLCKTGTPISETCFNRLIETRVNWNANESRESVGKFAGWDQAQRWRQPSCQITLIPIEHDGQKSFPLFFFFFFSNATYDRYKWPEREKEVSITLDE